MLRSASKNRKEIYGSGKIVPDAASVKSNLAFTYLIRVKVQTPLARLRHCCAPSRPSQGRRVHTREQGKANR